MISGPMRDRSESPGASARSCRSNDSASVDDAATDNPHSPFSLQFEVNTDGHVAGAPRDAFFKSGAGGFGLYVIPSLDMVIYKMSSLNEETYDPAGTGLPLTYAPDTSRDTWKPHPFNQFVDGPISGDVGVRRTLEMVVAAAA